MGALRCRSRKAVDCYDGQPEERFYGEMGMDTDGTWDGETVVCDACYIAIGQPAVPFDSPGADEFGRLLEGGKGTPRTG